MLKKTVAFLVLSTVAFGHGWPSGYYPSYYRNYNYYPGVSGGTATAIGIGAGVRPGVAQQERPGGQHQGGLVSDLFLGGAFLGFFSVCVV